MCRKQSGIAIGRLCDKCDGKCPVCDSYVRPTTLVRICDECSFGNYQNKCVVCGGEVSLLIHISLSAMHLLNVMNREYLMPSIASSAPGLKRIEMAAQKSSTLGHQEQTYSTRKRVSGIIELALGRSFLSAFGLD